MRKLLSKPVALAIAALLLVAAAAWLAYALTSGKRAKVEARLNRNQAGAAIGSGKDAVDTLGRQQAREGEADKLTRENERTIRDAQGADAPVAKPAQDAGIQALCRRAAYRDSPRCVRLREQPSDR